MLTDRPGEATGLVPPAWQPASWQKARGLEGRVSSWWDVVSDGAQAWQLETRPGTAPEGSWPLVVVLGAPRRSPFDMLREHVGTDSRRAGPLACVSLEGKALHGHRGRAWVAAAGNLHLSVVVPVRLAARTHAAVMSMVTAVAAIDAVRAITHDAVQPGIKWVNDLVVGDRKVGGVLAATQVRGALIEGAVLGIGLNVSVAPAITPTPFVPASVSLRECAPGGDLALGTVLWRVLDSLATRLRRLDLEGPWSVLQDYLRWSVVVGRRVRIWNEGLAGGSDVRKWPAPTAAGLVVGLGPDLALAVEGQRHAVREGQLAFEEVCQSFGL